MVSKQTGQEMWQNILETGQKGAPLGQAAAKYLYYNIFFPQMNLFMCP